MIYNQEREGRLLFRGQKKVLTGCGFLGLVSILVIIVVRLLKLSTYRSIYHDLTMTRYLNYHESSLIFFVFQQHR